MWRGEGTPKSERVRVQEVASCQTIVSESWGNIVGKRSLGGIPKYGGEKSRAAPDPHITNEKLVLGSAGNQKERGELDDRVDR